MENENVSLDGLRVLVTGGTTGLGRATAKLLSENGAKVLVFGRDERALADALRSFATENIRGLKADATDRADLRRVFDAVDQQLGGLDVLICNAALAADGLLEMNDDDWRYAIETNLTAYLSIAKEGALRMIAAGRGHIVLIGSLSAVVREKGSSVYVTTKAGVEGFAEAFAKEVNPRGVKVSLIEPGAIGSDMSPVLPADQQQAIERAEMLRAEDVASCVEFVLTRPWRAEIMSLQVRPHRQEIALH
jgi:NAD(P)-dependent dehydrogenase (short-subunit alcohol dehydrogenase family)